MRSDVVSQGQGELHEKAVAESAGSEHQCKGALQIRAPVHKGERTGKPSELNLRSKGCPGLARFSEEPHAVYHGRDSVTGVEKLLKRTQSRSGNPVGI